MALFVEVVADKTDADGVALAAWSTGRMSVQALRDLVVRGDDRDGVTRRRELVQVFARLRRGAALCEALALTAHYVDEVRAIDLRGRAAVRAGVALGDDARTTRMREKLALDYLAELGPLDLEELSASKMSPVAVAAELAGEGKRAGGRPRGAATVLARILVLGRDGAIDQKLVVLMQAAITMANTRHRERIARLSAE